ncbi:MAG: pyridoxal phosphate-dependent aminotransferase [Christensenellales bacterium]
MNFLSRLSRAVELKLAEGGFEGDTIDLSSLTSPYSPSPAVGRALKNIDVTTLNRFPEKNVLDFRQVIADRYGLACNNVFIYDGCDKLLSLCMKAYFDEGDVLAFADVTYEYYKRCATLNSLNYTTVAVDSHMKIDTKSYMDVECDGILICNPNNPTAIAINKLELLDLVSARPDVLFIIDERYAEFGSSSVAEFVSEHDNLVVLKGLSAAYSLAAVNFGYVLASPTLIGGLKNLRLNIDDCAVDCLTQKVAQACFEDVKYMSIIVDKIINAREELCDRLRQMGFEVLPSSANFILCKHAKVASSVIEFQLKEQGISVRHFKSKRLSDYLRITVSTPENMDILLKKLKPIVK